MKHRRSAASRARGLRAPAAIMCAALAAVAVAGCGEITNTIHPPADTANNITVALAGQPNAFYAGIYEAQARGYFTQTDLNVHIVVPQSGENAVDMVHGGQALFGVASEPTIFLHRNAGQPVVGVGALVHGPLSAITVPVPKEPSGGKAVTTGTSTSVTTTPATTTGATRSSTTSTTTSSPATTTFAEPDATEWPASLQQLLSKPGYPTYDGLVLVVSKGSIVDHAGLLRRFVQAVARGYRAARANPVRAVADLVKAVPALASQKALQLSILNSAMPYFFPPGEKVWGWMKQAQWNTFGTWMMQNHLINNPNAITDASTNELLQGQGV